MLGMEPLTQGANLHKCTTNMYFCFEKRQCRQTNGLRRSIVTPYFMQVSMRLAVGTYLKLHFIMDFPCCNKHHALRYIFV